MRAGLIPIGLAAAALAGCAQTDALNHMEGGVGYRSVVVGSSDASDFYYVPADQWATLGADDGARLAAVSVDHGYSPVKANSPVKMTIGQRYVIIPVCGGQPRWDHAIKPVIDHQDTLSLAC